MTTRTIPVSSVSYALFASTASAPLWLLLRLYVGYEWLMAGWEKFTNPAWWGAGAGSAMTGFAQGALAKTAGAHPDVQAWYASFLQHAVLPHAAGWAHAITLGEMAVGLGILAGVLTGVAAFFGGVMNMNFLLSGTVSINPLLLLGAFLLVVGWRVAGWWGGDRFVLPRFSRAYAAWVRDR